MTAVMPTDRPGDADREPDGQRAASWLLGLALSLVMDGADDDAATEELVVESGGSVRALQGAYGRGVVLLSEYPADSTLRQAVDLTSKALLRRHREARAGGPA